MNQIDLSYLDSLVRKALDLEKEIADLKTILKVIYIGNVSLHDRDKWCAHEELSPCGCSEDLKLARTAIESLFNK